MLGLDGNFGLEILHKGVLVSLSVEMKHLFLLLLLEDELLDNLHTLCVVGRVGPEYQALLVEVEVSDSPLDILPQLLNVVQDELYVLSEIYFELVLAGGNKQHQVIWDGVVPQDHDVRLRVPAGHSSSLRLHCLFVE